MRRCWMLRLRESMISLLEVRDITLEKKDSCLSQVTSIVDEKIESEIRRPYTPGNQEGLGLDVLPLPDIRSARSASRSRERLGAPWLVLASELTNTTITP